MKIQQIVKEYIPELKSVSDSPQSEIEEILMSLLGIKSRGLLYTKNLDLSPFFKHRVDNAIKQRKKHIPLQYLTKESIFYGLKFETSDSVFIPRPETELLVEYLIASFGNRKNLRILEIGTGSGVISICLTKFMRHCKIIATDISFQAITQARRNVFLNKCSQNIFLLQADSLQFLKRGVFFDIIVSNPPYVGQGEYSSLSPEVKKEPRIALIGGKEGYEFSLKLIMKSRKYMAENSCLVLEINPRQKDFYFRVLSSDFKVEFLKDFQGWDRVMILEFQNG